MTYRAVCCTSGSLIATGPDRITCMALAYIARPMQATSYRIISTLEPAIMTQLDLPLVERPECDPAYSSLRQDGFTPKKSVRIIATRLAYERAMRGAEIKSPDFFGGCN